MQFSARLVAFATSIVLITIALSSVLVYVRATDELEESLAHELMAIARSTASLIDADPLELIYLDDRGEISFMDEFMLLREQLDHVRTMNQLPDTGNPIYIMRPLPDFAETGHLEFVVMPDRDEHGRYFVGNVYPAKPHHREALRGQAAATGVYTDDEGSWISATAPLRDSLGEIVGLVQVDRPVSFFYARVRSQAYAILWVALVSVLAGVGLAIAFSRTLIGPIREIADGVRAFGSGELSRRVHVARQDEIGELARGFNVMAIRVEQDTQRLEQARESALAALQSKSELISNMDAINRVLTALARATSRDDAARITMQSICECYGWAYACCWIVDPAERALGFAMDWGRIERSFKDANRDVKLAKGIGLPGRAWALNTVVAADDRPDEHGYQPLTPQARAAGASSSVAIPIAVGGEVEFVLEFVTLGGGSVSIALQETLTGVAQLLSESIERMRAEADTAAVTAESGLVDAALREVATATTPEAVLRGLADAARRAFGWRQTVAWRVEGDALTHVADSSHDPLRAWSPAFEPASAPWLADCTQRGRLVEASPAQATATTASGAPVPVGVCCVAVVSGGEPLGIIEALHDGPITLSDSRRESLESVARLAADSCARLIAAERRQHAGAQATEIMERVASGDLSVGMEGSFDGEYEILQRAINTSVANLRTMVRGIREVTVAISSGASAIRDRNEALLEQTQAQSDEIARCTQGVAELGESIRDNARRCDGATSLAERARTLATQGSTVASQAAGLMSDVETTTREISDVIAVIDGIAERTNLLALNASIEAARAGEAGRGFAIVASEVEDLARRCGAAAQDVRGLVTRTVDSVHEGVASVRHSGKMLDEIVSAVSSASDGLGEIAKATDQQASGVELVEEVMSRLDAATHRYTEYMRDVSDSIRRMAEQAAELDGQVDSFRIEAQAGERASTR